jgi:hypothetical protein
VAEKGKKELSDVFFFIYIGLGPFTLYFIALSNIKNEKHTIKSMQ